MFSSEAWEQNRALTERICQMPFNAELSAGTLSLDRFQHYIVQDAHYLVAFAQALALAAAKSDDPSLVIGFSSAASGAITVERALHESYFRQFGLSAETVASTPVSPTCHHYTSYLIATGFREPLPVVLAAMLPCFTVYREVGRRIVASAVEPNPYRAWIETYGGEDFGEAVDRMISRTDALAATAAPETIAAMHRAVTRATQLEWMFWDSAYRLEQWPV